MRDEREAWKDKMSNEELEEKYWLLGAARERHFNEQREIDMLAFRHAIMMLIDMNVYTKHGSYGKNYSDLCKRFYISHYELREILDGQTPVRMQCLECYCYIRKYSYRSHIKNTHNMEHSEYLIKWKYNGQPPLCECGCGKETTYARKLYGFNVLHRGHNMKKEKQE